MESPAQSPEAIAAGLAREASLAMLALVRDLAWNCLLSSAWRLPLAVAACVLACSIMALVPATALSCRGTCPLSAGSGMFVLLMLYGLAGTVWGLHATVHRVVRRGVAALERRVPWLFDVLTAPLVALGEGSLPALPVSDVRDYFARATTYVAGDAPQGKWWRRLVAWGMRLCLRVPSSAVEQVLARIEGSGQTHVSLATLKTCARDELIARALGAVRVQLFHFDLAAAAIVLGLLVVPAAIVMWLAA